MPAMSAWRSESSPRVAEISVRSTWTNSTGSAPVCRTSARSCASSERVEARDLGAAARDAVRVLGEVDHRERADLVVEDDGEALVEDVLLLVRGRPGEVGLLRAADGELAGDVVELLAALVREVEEDDRLAALAEVLARVGEVVAGERGNRVLRRVGRYSKR